MTDFSQSDSVSDLQLALESCRMTDSQGGRYTATWNREFKLPWRKAGPPYYFDDQVDSDHKLSVKISLTDQLSKATEAKVVRDHLIV